MDYFDWIQNIDLENPDEVYEQLIWLINQNLEVKQKLFAVDLLVRKSKGVYIAHLKKQIKNLSEEIESLKEFRMKYHLKSNECTHLQKVLAQKNFEAKDKNPPQKKKYVVVRRKSKGLSHE